MTSKPRLVIIDDTDARIKYSIQGWFPDNEKEDNTGDFGSVYNHTQHGTNTNGAHINFAFQGTGFQFYGRSDYVKTDNGSSSPNFSCTIDGAAVNTVPPPFPDADNQVLCAADSLTDGPHNVVATIATAGKNLWFDYVLYEPSGTTNETTLQNKTLVINNNYTPLVYSDGWSILNDTLRWTQKKDATLKFDFIGTGITWYSLLPQGFPQQAASGTYSVDGESSVTFSVPWSNTNRYHQPLFSTTNLSTGSHSLTVTYQGDDNHAPLTLNYLILAPNIGPSGSTSTHPSSEPSPPNGDSSQPGSNSKTPIGAIVGGVIGGIAVIVGIFLLWLLHRRRTRVLPSANLSLIEDDKTPELVGTSPPDARITPFALSNGSSTRRTDSISKNPSTLRSMSNSSALQSSHDQPASLEQDHSRLTISSASPVHTGLAPLAKAEPARRLRLVHHEDSGNRFTEEEETVIRVDVPPGYTER